MVTISNPKYANFLKPNIPKKPWINPENKTKNLQPEPLSIDRLSLRPKIAKNPDRYVSNLISL
jgi:hypothetical protein